MSQAIQISETRYQDLLSRISKLESMVAKLFKKLEQPKYGSDEWWEKSDRESLEEYKNGEYYELKDKEAMKDFFKHISDEKYVYDKFYNKSKKTSK
jgi:hypothetical protein